MTTTIIVDGNWMFNRAATVSETPHRIAWSVISMACADAVFAKADRMLIAFDGPQIFRYELWPLYKISRKGVKLTKEQLAEATKNRKIAKAIASQVQGGKEIYNSLPLVQHYISELGIPWIQPQKAEADDVLASASASLDGTVVLDAPDKDIYQCLVNKNTKVLGTKYNKDTKKMERKYVRRKDVMEKFGVTPEQMIDYQTLVGDAIDYILPIIGPKTAAKLLTEHGTLAKVLKAEPDIAKRVTRLELNRKLVTLSTDIAIPRLELGSRGNVKAPKSYSEWIASMSRGSLF